MLIRDHEHFIRAYPSALSYIKEAEARFDLYVVLRELKQIDQTSDRAIWIRSYVREARQSPACQEPWFLGMLAQEHGGIAKSLLVLMDSIP